MFESFYGFSRTPFSRDIPTDCLYDSLLMQEVVGRLEYVAQRQLFMVITGASGIGKTTVIRKFSDQLDSSAYKLLYLADSKLTPRHFYKGLLEQLGCESRFYRGAAKRQLHHQIELMRGLHHQHPIVVIDEAHLLDREMLEEVRFLLNFRMDAMSPMALILTGQTELWDRLQLQTYAAIRQRVDLQYRLAHFDQSQVTEYIQSHLTYAGTDHAVFTDAAIAEIHLFSSGAARLINKLCTICLMHGAQHGRRVIDDHMVKLVIQAELS